MARPQVFNGTLGKVLDFVIAYKLYLRIKIRGIVVEEQIQWILSYIQEGSVDVLKENILEDLKGGLLEYKTLEEFLAKIKKEFGGRQRSSKSGRVKKIRVRGKNYEEIHTGV